MQKHTLHDRFRVRWVLRFLLSFSFFLVPAYIGLGRAGLTSWRTAWILGAAAGFILVLGFPVAVLMWVKSWVFALLTLTGAAIFFVTDQKCSCARCLNFSCLLNRVPADIRKAWEAG